MATEATTSTATSQENDRGSRTVFHIFVGLLAAGVLVAALGFFSFYSQYFHARQVRAIQQGVEVDLRLIYDAQQKFHAKHGAYTTDFAALWIAPKKVLYKFGFVTPSTDALPIEGIDPSRKDLDALKKAMPELKIDYSPVTKLESIDFDKMASYCPDCTATQTTFKAIAVANLDDDAALDIWTIDEKGNIVHVVNDL